MIRSSCPVVTNSEQSICYTSLRLRGIKGDSAMAPERNGDDTYRVTFKGNASACALAVILLAACSDYLGCNLS